MEEEDPHLRTQLNREKPAEEEEVETLISPEKTTF